MKTSKAALVLLWVGCAEPSRDDGPAWVGETTTTTGSTGSFPSSTSSMPPSSDASTTSTADPDTSSSGAVERCRPAPAPDIDGFHVSVDGTPDGDGSARAPWDLDTALSGPAAVVPGSTLLLHGGTYPGGLVATLEGTAKAPIEVRSAPGEWAVLDGNGIDATTLEVRGHHTRYRDFEITNTDLERFGGRRPGLYVYGEAVEMVNLVVHDTGLVGLWSTAVDAVFYGCLSYFNGYDDEDRAHGHGLYTQNASGTKRIEDNVIFSNYSFGVHAYTEGGSIEGFDVRGNVWFGNGWPAAGEGNEKDNCLIGGLQPAARVVLEHNIGWAQPTDARSVRLGYSHPDNDDLTLRGNYFVGRTLLAQPWASVLIEDNTFIGPLDGTDPSDHPDNTYGRSTDGPTVFVRPNAYDPERVMVVVHNPSGVAEVSVDLADIAPPRAWVEARSAQDILGPPVVAQPMHDGQLQLPLLDLPVATPIGGPDALSDQERTAGAFEVFVVSIRPC